MFYNTHIHTLNKNHIPDQFLPFKLMRLLSKNKVGRVFAKFLNVFYPFSDKDVFNRYANFISTAGCQTQKEVFLQLYNIYKKFCDLNKIEYKDLRFVVLSMDLTFMGAGKLKVKYEDQIEELNLLVQEEDFKNNIIPALFIDPRRENINELIDKYLLNGNFKVAKMYPPLGYMPDDDRLSKIYYTLEKNTIPIITHCSKGGIYNHKESKNKCQFYTHPLNWKDVLKNYPDLKICLAHAGGEQDFQEFIKGGSHPNKNWLCIILDMLKLYNNLYVDISYTLYNFEYFPILKLLLKSPDFRNKILFGSDYYMQLVERKNVENTFLSLKDYLGEEDFKIITETNPSKFFE